MPFFPQQQYHCGPAALAMLLAQRQVSVTPEELVQRVYLPHRKGSLQIELVATSRAYDHLPYVIDPKLDALIEELRAGNPVLVMQNLGLGWLPNWHYAVVTGFDPQQQQILLHSGLDANRRLALRTFLRTWQRSGHWGLVVLPAGQLPARPDMTRYLEAALALEQTSHTTAALQAYQAAIAQWPQQPTPWLTLGNYFFSSGQYRQAADMFRQATIIAPDSGVAFNNLAQSYLELGLYSEAQAMAETAVHLGGPFADSFAQTLQTALAHQH